MVEKINTSIKPSEEVDKINEIIDNIDEVVTDLNGKANIDLSNCTKPHIVETYNNGTSWYRVYSDGWCEQGGKLVSTITNGGEVKISLIKAYVNTSYNIQVSGIHISGKWGYSSIGTGAITANSFYVFAAGNSSPDGTQATYWKTCGYIS